MGVNKQKVILSVVAVLAFLSITQASGIWASPQILGMDGMSAVRGGQDYYCVTGVAATSSTRCDDCLSNGNGKYIKCTDATAPTKDSDYVSGQTPAQRWDVSMVGCAQGQNSAKTYNASDCTGNLFSSGTCYRMYSKATFISFPPGGNCR